MNTPCTIEFRLSETNAKMLITDEESRCASADELGAGGASISLRLAITDELKVELLMTNAFGEPVWRDLDGWPARFHGLVLSSERVLSLAVRLMASVMWRGAVGGVSPPVRSWAIKEAQKLLLVRDFLLVGETPSGALRFDLGEL